MTAVGALLLIVNGQFSAAQSPEFRAGPSGLAEARPVVPPAPLSRRGDRVRQNRRMSRARGPARHCTAMAENRKDG